MNYIKDAQRVSLNSLSRNFGRLLALAALLAAPIARAGGGDAPAAATMSAATAKDAVKVTETGAEPRLKLRLHPKVGDKQTVTMTMKMSMEMSMAGQTMPPTEIPATITTMSFEVKDLATNGDISYNMTTDDVTLDSGPNTPAAILDAMRSSIAGLRAMSATGTVSSKGENVSLKMNLPADADQQLSQTMDQMSESLKTSSVRLPEEAVGAGAKWEYSTQLESKGMKINQTARYELVSISGDAMTLKTTLTQTAPKQDIHDPSMGDASATLMDMTSTGSGNTTFDLKRIMPNSGKMGVKNSTVISAGSGDQAQSMTMKMTMDISIDTK